MNMFKLETPITFIFFNRLDTTLEVLECIRQAKPQKLFLVSDGARENKEGEKELVESIRAEVESNIDWPCEVYKDYAEVNMGCHKRMVSGISWAFKYSETMIILEDDIVAVPSFFQYCQELLEKYKKDNRVTYITGNNIYHKFDIKESYTFSKFPSIWGWATWRRAWELYDDNFETWNKIKSTKCIENYYGEKWSKFYKVQIEKAYLGEVDTWDYQWEASRMWNEGLGIIPKYNMIENIGFNRLDATHTQGESMYDFTKKDLEFPLKHPKEIQNNCNYDNGYLKDVIAKEFAGWTFKGKVLRKLSKLFKK